MNKNLLVLACTTALYFLSIYTSVGVFFAHPIEVLVAFLHEFGHATMAILTGGHVNTLQVNPDGSGVTKTSGGSQSLITIGGYVGSCIFSNILIRMSCSKYSPIACYVLGVLSAISAVCWFSTVENMAILAAFAVSFVVIGKLKVVTPYVLQFISIACVVHIIQDFQVGPSSDLNAFTQIIGILPYTIWMYVWLGIVILVTFFNIKHLLKQQNEI